MYRGQKWFVLQDNISGRQHRLNEAAWCVVVLMDGIRTLQQIYDIVLEKTDDSAPDQNDIIQLLTGLHTNELIQWNTKADPDALSAMHQTLQRQKWLKYLHNPLMLRIPLCDPDSFLEKNLSLVKPLFTKFNLVVWILGITLALIQTAMHWPELAGNFSEKILSEQNLIIMFLCYPIIKLLHELGHAFATKIWGGEVHEAGIIFLVFIPIPYVNASTSTNFPEKHKRIIVGSAGIMMETFLASLALFVWLSVETGIVSTIAYNVMIIGGVSTLLFNGNPLLRFDGYYIFSDLIDIPNLARRASQYYGYLSKRYIFGVEQMQPPSITKGERNWFLFYAPAALAYRLFIMFTIILMVAGKFFFFGVVLAIWAGVMQLIVPVAKYIMLLFKNPLIQQQKRRAITATVSIMVFIIGFFFLLPFPHQTTEEGVIWLSENARVRAGTDGFVQELLATPDTMVKAGTPIIRFSDPQLETKIKLLELKYRELKANYVSIRTEDRVEAQIIKESISATEAELKDVRKRVSQLIVTSPVDGKLVIPQAEDLPGKFIKQGEQVAFILDTSTPVVRVAVSQSNINLIRKETQDVSVKISGDLMATWPATIKREVPTSSNQLPSAVLGGLGGGKIAVDPTDETGVTTLQKIFQLDLALPDAACPAHSKSGYAGKRVYVQFDFGTEPLATQWFRSIRQLLLKQLNI
ncbi:MAG: PqqD family peptide modification chaperone [Gammaproteobacteria bacterium]|nr:PqqD family peptide modification chaperone [Gammaproteobacteria bacterium]